MRAAKHRRPAAASTCDAADRSIVRTGAAGASQLKSFTRETPETTALTLSGMGYFVKLTATWRRRIIASIKQHRPAGRCLGTGPSASLVVSSAISPRRGSCGHHRSI